MYPGQASYPYPPPIKPSSEAPGPAPQPESVKRVRPYKKRKHIDQELPDPSGSKSSIFPSRPALTLPAGPGLDVDKSLSPAEDVDENDVSGAAIDLASPDISCNVPSTVSHTEQISTRYLTSSPSDLAPNPPVVVKFHQAGAESYANGVGCA